MHRFLISSLIVSSAACGGAAAAGGGAPTTAEAAAQEAKDRTYVAELEARTEAQERQITELEARLALLEREARSARAVHAKPTETVRIGESRARSRDRDGAEFDSEEPAYETLRLTAAAAPERWVPPAIPPGVEGTLPVAPLPEATLAGSEPGTPAVEAPPSSGEARARYRAALGLLRERRFDDAADAFSRWTAEFPDHELFDDAVYWQGEAHYARRRYQEALERFERLIADFPATPRLADVLLKVGLCRRHLGDAAGARAYFERVRAEFPDTGAARLVPPEGAS